MKICPIQKIFVNDLNVMCADKRSAPLYKVYTEKLFIIIIVIVNTMCVFFH